MAQAKSKGVRHAGRREPRAKTEIRVDFAHGIHLVGDKFRRPYVECCCHDEQDRKEQDKSRDQAARDASPSHDVLVGLDDSH